MAYTTYGETCGDVSLTLESPDEDEESTAQINPTTGEFSIEYDESESVWSSQSDYFDEFSYSITVKPADVDSKAEKLKDVIEKRGEASGSGWTKKLFGIDALHAETLHCPNCSEEFDKDSWIPHDGFHSATSPKWSYACPSDSCQTLFIFDRTE